VFVLKEQRSMAVVVCAVVVVVFVVFVVVVFVAVVVSVKGGNRSSGFVGGSLDKGLYTRHAAWRGSISVSLSLFRCLSRSVTSLACVSFRPSLLCSFLRSFGRQPLVPPVH
jgi:hypothetical protein